MLLSFLLLVPAALLLIFTLLPLSRCEKWWVRGWDFPRLQLLFLSAGLATAALATRSLTPPTVFWSVVGATGACMAWHAWWIFAFTRLAAREAIDADPSRSTPQLSVLSANVLMSNRQPAPLIDLIRDLRPDIFVTLESDAWWEKQLDEAFAADYPHAVKCPLDNLYGMHVYSRHPLEDPRLEFLVEKDVPSVHATLVLPGGLRVELHALHPAPPSPSENEESTERDAELILVARQVARRGGPAIVFGDLNDVAWSRTTELFRKISGLLDPRRGRGMCNTYHAQWFFLRWPLDHLFHSTHFTVVEMKRLRAIGSDHFPIFVRLAFEPDKTAVQRPAEPDADDQKMAQEKLEM